MRGLLAFLLINFSLFAQEKILSLPNDALDLKHDYFDTQYIIYYNKVEAVKSEHFYYQYANPFLGKLETIDLKNNLDILLFYKEFSTVVILDNRMTEKYSIDFERLFPEIKPIFVGVNRLKDFWIVDEISGQLFLYTTTNQEMKKLYSGIDVLNSKFYNDASNFYIQNSNDITEIDLYGRIVTIEITQDFEEILYFDHNWVIGKVKGKIIAWNIEQDKKLIITDFDSTMNRFSIFNNQLSIVKGKEVLIFKLSYGI